MNVTVKESGGRAQLKYNRRESWLMLEGTSMRTIACAGFCVQGMAC